MDEVVEPAPAPAAAPTDEWTRIFDGLRQRFPGASEGVLFCIHKLQQNPEVRLRDFKEEAALHGVTLSGRSHYSARVMLGLEQPAPRRRRRGDEREEEEQAAAPERARAGAEPEEDIPAIAALRRFQREHAAEIERLRAGIRQALAVIDAALAQE